MECVIDILPCNRDRFRRAESERKKPWVSRDYIDEITASNLTPECGDIVSPSSLCQMVELVKLILQLHITYTM